MSRLSDLADAVHVTLDDSSVKKVIGKVNDGKHGPRRRIHWYHTGGVVQTVSQAGGRLTESDTVREPAVWERLGAIDCLVFAENDETAETLLDNLIVAISQTAPNGSAIFEDYVWQHDEIAQREPLATLRVLIKWPVVDEISPLTEITDEEHSCEID